VVADRITRSPVVYRGPLPDLFREGQGIVALGAYDQKGVFQATEVLAKHDEKYMPAGLAQALKAQGEWRGNGAPPAYAAASTSAPRPVPAPQRP
jgi:cytochrome c-type biogenesis protein CcmE